MTLRILAEFDLFLFLVREVGIVWSQAERDADAKLKLKTSVCTNPTPERMHGVLCKIDYAERRFKQEAGEHSRRNDDPFRPNRSRRSIRDRSDYSHGLNGTCHVALSSFSCLNSRTPTAASLRKDPVGGQRVGYLESTQRSAKPASTMEREAVTGAHQLPAANPLQRRLPA
jgi:hypothetical protein